MIQVVIVAHHARRQAAECLARELGAHVILDEVGRGALWGHHMALKWAAGCCERVVVMEDDALPVEGFADLAREWLDAYPDDLVSFYLGTGRPPQWQPKVSAALHEADRRGESYIVLPDLIHGVCYSIPAPLTAELVNGLPEHGAADYAIGGAWRRLTGRSIVYPVRSLVDHADGQSVERHPDGQRRAIPRRAWRLYGAPAQMIAGE